MSSAAPSSEGTKDGKPTSLTLDDVPKYWYPDRQADMHQVGIGYLYYS